MLVRKKERMHQEKVQKDVTRKEKRLSKTFKKKKPDVNITRVTTQQNNGMLMMCH